MREKTVQDYVFTYFWILITLVVIATALVSLGVLRF